MAKQSQESANTKNLSTYALLGAMVLITIIFVLNFDLSGSENSVWPWLIVPALALIIVIPMLRKTKIERYYEAICAAHSDVKPLRKLKREGDIYTFKMPTGMSKSQYQKYQEGLEQYLDSKVDFRFEHNLIIRVTGEKPEP